MAVAIRPTRAEHSTERTSNTLKRCHDVGHESKVIGDTPWALRHLWKLTTFGGHTTSPPLILGLKRAPSRVKPMKIRNSLKSLKGRDKDCRVIRRKGRVYVINKKNPRFKARQG